MFSRSTHYEPTPDDDGAEEKWMRPHAGGRCVGDSKKRDGEEMDTSTTMAVSTSDDSRRNKKRKKKLALICFHLAMTLLEVLDALVQTIYGGKKRPLGVSE